jgi:hypothetical protein
MLRGEHRGGDESNSCCSASKGRPAPARPAPLRDAILDAVVARTFVALAQTCPAAAAADPRGMPAVEAISLAYVAFARENPGQCRVLFERSQPTSRRRRTSIARESQVSSSSSASYQATAARLMISSRRWTSNQSSLPCTALRPCRPPCMHFRGSTKPLSPGTCRRKSSVGRQKKSTDQPSASVRPTRPGRRGAGRRSLSSRY